MALPGAPASILVQRKATPSPAENAHAQKSGTSTAVAGEPRATRTRPLIDVLDGLSEQKKPANKPAPEAEASGPSEITPAPPAEKAPEAPLIALQLLECPGQVLIIDELHQNRAQTQLVANMLYAMTLEPAHSYKSMPLDWASIPPGSSAQDVLHGVLARSRQQGTLKVLLLGDQAAKALGVSAVEGMVDADGDMAECTVAKVPSSIELLQRPELKARAWGLMQSLKAG